ncbi:hypothetical protein DVT68_06845 [Dyella solisilvae]|uniref:Uncharacterized protein n=1 Tax=Dyella solisilvae TaxID=1920168 RepID=A0A370KCZ5_9GAMM|nr:DUF6348 family protein [Dyella solisilvae]RDJ00503.1 hypothetical protein DVT68_06845 [Dyella solisilvae]
MQDTALQSYLLRLFERHDVELEPDEEWLMTDGDFPAVRASWYDGADGQPGRLDVDIVLSEERHIEESFAGAGGGDSGCRQALEAFERSVFHVLLAACWYVTDDRRMHLESWDLGVRTWDVFVGPVQSSHESVEAPAGLLASLRDALQSEALSAELHWVRLFYRRDEDGQVSAEALLDNAPWPAGDRLLAALEWPSAVKGYNVRGFVALDIRDY